MDIQKIDINLLKPAEYNPRKKLKKSDKEYIKIKNSIEKFGYIDPIILNKDFTVIGGHQRLTVLKDLKYKEIDCVVVDISKEEEKALNIGLNKISGDWDKDLLKDLFLDLKLTDIDLNLTGFDDIEISELIGEELTAEEDDFEVPNEDEIKTDIVLGDLFEIGEHRLLCGDSTDSDSVAKLMNGDKADMVFTDPPYNINYGNIKHSKFKQREIENDNMSRQEFVDFCQGFASNIKIFCKGIIYCWAGPGADGRIMFTVLDNMFHCSTMIVWNKDQFTLGRGKYQNKHEVCWFGWNENGSTFTEDRTLTNVWDFARPKKSELHPTMKPINLVENGLNHASKQGDKVLDLFLGSGSTMVASHQLKRKCYGMELDPKYCQVIIDRMRKLDPTLIIKKNGVII